MNESHRAVAQYIVYVCCTGCGAVLESTPSSCVLWLFCVWGAAKVHKEGQQPSQTNLRSGALGRTVGEVEDLRKEACVHRV